MVFKQGVGIQVFMKLKFTRKIVSARLQSVPEWNRIFCALCIMKYLFIFGDEYIHQYKMKKTITVLLILLCFCLQAQQVSFDDYRPLECEGTIPADFFFRHTDLLVQAQKPAPGGVKQREDKTREAFWVSSNFYLRELLSSGKVLFGDPVSRYVNNVADTLLKDFPELRKELRFYVTRSYVVNAFSTDHGIIFVNLGLIAQLENEAQLAYALAHEIVHYVKKHNMELFLEADKINRNSRVLNKMDYEDKLFAMNYRSKEAETEADREGLQTYFVNSDYSLSGMTKLFDVLLYSYLPFDEVDFDKSMFEMSFFTFPDDYMLDSTSAIDADKYFTDDSGDHPSLQKRVAEAEQLLASIDKSGRKDFCLPHQTFVEIRNIARFECLRLRILSGDYYYAVYDAFLLKREFPESRYLNFAVTAVLYNLTKYRNAQESVELQSFRKIQGAAQKVYYFFYKLSRKELNTLALGYAWRIYQKYPTDQYLKLVCNDLASDLVKIHELDSRYFYSKPRQEPAQITAEDPQTNADTTQSKYDKIKRQKQNRKSPAGDEYFLRYAFVDLMNDANFVDMLKQYEEEFKAEQENSAKYPVLNPFGQIQPRTRMKKCKNNCIERIVLADPYYLQFDSRKQDEVYYNDTEKKNVRLNQIVLSNAARINLTVTLIDPGQINASDVTQLNHLALMNDYIRERFNNSEVTLVPYETNRMNDVMLHYNTPYLGWMGVLSARISKASALYGYIWLTIIPYTMPYGIYKLAAPRYYSYYYNVLFDTRNGKAISWQASRSEGQFRTDILNQKIYDSFYQIKRLPGNVQEK